MSYELLQRIEPHRTETTAKSSVRLGRTDHIPMHRTQMFQKMRFLLEHRDAQATCERLLAGVHAQMGFQIPGHTELLAAVLAPVLAHRRRIAGLRAAGAAAGARARRAVSAGLLVVDGVLHVGDRAAGERIGGRQRQRGRVRRPRVHERRRHLHGGVGARRSPAIVVAVMVVRVEEYFGW